MHKSPMKCARRTQVIETCWENVNGYKQREGESASSTFAHTIACQNLLLCHIRFFLWYFMLSSCGMHIGAAAAAALKFIMSMAMALCCLVSSHWVMVVCLRAMYQRKSIHISFYRMLGPVRPCVFLSRSAVCLLCMCVRALECMRSTEMQHECKTGI